ncbi:MAG: hypothetical protein ACTSPY_04320 [Candidatus Helarchaeota archaeon]
MMELTPRQITISIAFPIVVAVFIILGILVLRKDMKYWGNKLFTAFFWVIAVALMFNVSYLFSTNVPLISILNLITIELINLGVLPLILGTLVIYKGEEQILKSRSTSAIIGVYVGTVIGHILISNNNSVSIEFDPNWSLEFGIYELVFSQIVLASIFIISIMMYRGLSKETKNKFKWFLIGLMFIDTTLISITIDNINIIPGYDTIGAVLNFMVVIGAILIYRGIVRK